jgi:hypothetical protein
LSIAPLRRLANTSYAWSCLVNHFCEVEFFWICRKSLRRARFFWKIFCEILDFIIVLPKFCYWSLSQLN